MRSIRSAKAHERHGGPAERGARPPCLGYGCGFSPSRFDVCPFRAPADIGGYVPSKRLTVGLGTRQHSLLG